jgi:hypothetical protein
VVESGRKEVPQAGAGEAVGGGPAGWQPEIVIDRGGVIRKGGQAGRRASSAGAAFGLVERVSNGGQ